MYLFFDTETTGIPVNYKAPASDYDNWPRLVQVAWLLADEEGSEIECAQYLIKPQGFTIPDEVTQIHGITTAMALQEGVDLNTVLAAMTPMIEKASVLVAHNMEFDEKVLSAEFLRAGYANVVETKERICTMKAATAYCQLPGPCGYKWPNLQELHTKLFGEGFEGAHDALVDVRACWRCYVELKRLGVVA